MIIKTLVKNSRDLKCPYVLNLYKETSGSMVSDSDLEGKLLISDLKRTMSSIELLTLYPLAPGFSLEVILLDISQI